MSKALIIIDMWDKYLPGHDRFTSSIEQLSLRLASLMIRINTPIVVATYDTPNENPNYKTPWTNTNQTIIDALYGKPTPDDNLVSWNKDEVMKFLNSHNVTDLYFAGISFPGCVQGRELGINNMKDNFNCHVVIDCVLNTGGVHYTEYNIIHDTYQQVFASELSYIHSKDLG
tara:strand:- start:145 stop:660 length:516 start_codon:yes stop_codon:yes gene_type:complete